MKINALYEHLKKCNHQVSTDTRKVIKESIFFALKGKKFDGNNYAIEALKNGAAYCVVDNESVSKLDQRIFLVHEIIHHDLKQLNC